VRMGVWPRQVDSVTLRAKLRDQHVILEPAE
jgi:hypothetical protein